MVSINPPQELLDIYTCIYTAMFTEIDKLYPCCQNQYFPGGPIVINIDFYNKNLNFPLNLYGQVSKTMACRNV